MKNLKFKTTFLVALTFFMTGARVRAAQGAASGSAAGKSVPFSFADLPAIPSGYFLQALPLPAGQEGPYVVAINDSGQVLGDSFDLFTDNGVLWTNGAPQTLPNFGVDGTFFAGALSNNGTVVGYADLPPPPGQSFRNYHSFRWTSAGGIVDLNITTGPKFDFAVAVNDAGQIAGNNQSILNQGYLWQSGAATYSTLPPGYRQLNIYAMNAHGNVVGKLLAASLPTRPAIYIGGSPFFLDGDGSPLAVNANNQVVGESNLGATFWDLDRSVKKLTPPDGTSGIGAYSLNDEGVIVGSARGASGDVAVYWPDGASKGVDLNTRLAGDQAVSWKLLEADAINNRGQIAGYGLYNGQEMAFLMTPLELAVDANRDGRIKLSSEDASDLTSKTTPFRFWLNDDIDRGHTVDGDDYEQDDISPTEAATNSWVEDWKSNTVPSRRDLEDFARIVVSTSGLSDSFRNGDLYMGLKWTDTVGSPSIKLYKQYDATGGTSYLTDDYQASVQLAENAILNQRYPSDDVASPSAHTVVTPGDLFVLPQALWFGLSGDTLKRSLLFEGCTAGTGQLKLVILKRENGNYTEIGEGPGVWLDLRNIKDMYEHWTVGQGPVPYGGGAPGALSQASSFTYTAQSPEESKYILFVHGWNMQQWEKERFAETAYKRLYWQGYKGRFGLFSWPTTNGFDGIRSAITDSTNYDRGEFSAWRSASLLEQKLAQLNGQYPGQVHLLAHSMGNVVAGEALRRAGQDGLGVIVRTYVASQSALPVHCYNGSLSDNLDADVPASGLVRVFDGGWPQTANAYKSWLAANSAAVAKRVNFFNINDYALWRDVWQLNQWLKPDHPDFRANPPDPQRTYRYLDNINQPPTGDGFGWLRPGAQVDPSDRPDLNNRWVAVLHLGNAADVKDRYEIMAMACESRSKALGATPFNEGLDASLWLGSIWPTDPSGDARPYSRHKWHSAEFRSTNMLQKGYWQALLGPQGFNIVTPP